MYRSPVMLVLLSVAAVACAAPDVDFEKTISAAVKAGDFTKAKQLCEAWIEKKPTDERPHVILGRIYVKTNMTGKAIEAFEMARAFNPLNPEPICEEGKIFLEAGNAEEAIEEFQAALEVRKDYAPAVKGLAAAKALRDSPYANGVHVRLGETDEARGLTLKIPEQTLVTTIGGRQCRSTIRARGKFFMVLDVADEYIFDVDMPVRVAIEYYDIGRGSFRIRYDSTDTTAHRHGVQKVSALISKTNSKTWRTGVLNLPDAKFANRFWGRTDLAICSEAWEYREDVYISSVRVTQGGLAADVEPRIAVAGGPSTCTVTAKVVDAAGPVADGTVVRFTTDRGAITRQVETLAGAAAAVFRPGDEPGEAAISVQTAEDRRMLHVPIVPGRGGAVRRRLLLDSFEQSRAWRTEATKGSHVTLLPGPERPEGRRPSTRIVYRFTRNPISAVTLRRPMALPGRPAKLGLWVKTDGSHSRIQAILVDATGQTLALRVGTMLSQGWQWVEHDIGPAIYSSGGAADGRMHLPVRLDGLEIGRYHDPPGKNGGEICVQDLTLVTDVPRSATATALLDVNAAEPDSRFHLPRPPVFHVSLTNLGDEMEQSRVRWRVTDETDRVVNQAHINTVDIDPGLCVTTEVTVPVAEPGVYQACFTLNGDSEASTKAVTFLALRDMPHSNPAGQIRRDGKDMALRLDNRTDEAAQFNLSYRLLTAAGEVVRKGMLDKPRMTMEPGEVLDALIPVEGLAAGRYSALLLFDMGDGTRFTRLLPFDVYPEAVTVAAKIVTDGDRPVAGASLRARLIRRPHIKIDTRDRTLQEWSVQTDAAGLCQLSELRVPADVDLCRLYLDVVADALVDHQQAFRLSDLVSPDGLLRPTLTLQMTPGHGFTGRVVGDDGAPVPDATVRAMGMVKEKRRISRYHFYRPRKTDADGRFEFPVAPTADVALTVYASQWVPKPIVVSAGKRDSGDIQLEPGAIVTGTLLDEAGKPAPGYWVVAAAASRGSSPSIMGLVEVVAKTGPDGAFTLPPLKGEFVLSTPPSFQLGIVEERVHSPTPRLAVLPQTLTLDRDRVELELRAASLVRIAGRVLDVDGTPAKEIDVKLSCLGTGRRFMNDEALTDDEGRFAFEGIPNGQMGLMIRVPGIRSWQRARRIYLRAKPLDHVKGANKNGWVHVDQIDANSLNVDFQFQFWSSRDGFLGTSPAAALGKKSAPRGVLGGVGRAFQDIAKRLAQGTPLAGRVLDEAGNGVRGAQIRILLIRRPKGGEVAKGKVTGPWQAVTGADGRYACAAVPAPKDAEQYTVRVQIVAKGYATKRQDFPLPKLMTSGVRRLSVPDLRLKLEGGQ